MTAYLSARSPLFFAVAVSVLMHGAAAMLLPSWGRKVDERRSEPLRLVAVAPTEVRVPVAAPVVQPAHAHKPRVVRTEPTPPPPKPVVVAAASAQPLPVVTHAPEPVTTSAPNIEPAPAAPREVAPPAPVEPPPPAPRPVELAAARPSASDGVEPPHFNVAYLSDPKLDYPPAARRLRLQGTVIVRVQVSAAGLPESVRVEKSSGAELLDETALAAIRGWRFSPARRGSEPVAHWVDVPIRFRLSP